MSQDKKKLKTNEGLWAGKSAEELRHFLDSAARLWLAHDGLWFQAIERSHDMETAMDADREAWRRFSPIEAKRIMKLLGIAPGGGLEALEKALHHRLYSFLNLQETEWTGPDRLVFRMKTCRVQTARERAGLDDFPCKSIGIVEYEEFARTIDERIKVCCLGCPPDPGHKEFVCAWEFTLAEETEN